MYGGEKVKWKPIDLTHSHGFNNLTRLEFRGPDMWVPSIRRPLAIFAIQVLNCRTLIIHKSKFAWGFWCHAKRYIRSYTFLQASIWYFNCSKNIKYMKNVFKWPVNNCFYYNSKENYSVNKVTILYISIEIKKYC